MDGRREEGGRKEKKEEKGRGGGEGCKKKGRIKEGGKEG